jgi:aconitate hydratase
VTEYLKAAGLLEPLAQLGFNVVGYGCTTCIGNSGPLPEAVEKEILDKDLVACSVLSGNRNFEARVHQNVKANFLCRRPWWWPSPWPAGWTSTWPASPSAQGSDGPVFLKDIWPNAAEVAALLTHAANADTYRAIYADVGANNPLWDAVPAPPARPTPGIPPPPTSRSRPSSPMPPTPPPSPTRPSAAPGPWPSSATR